METSFNDFEYIKREIKAIELESINDKIFSFPIYYHNNKKIISFKPIAGIRISQVGFELDSLNINNLISCNTCKLYKFSIF